MDPLEITSPNELLVLAVAPEYEEEVNIDKEMGSEKEDPLAKLILIPKFYLQFRPCLLPPQYCLA